MSDGDAELDEIMAELRRESEGWEAELDKLALEAPKVDAELEKLADGWDEILAELEKLNEGWEAELDKLAEEAGSVWDELERLADGSE